MLDKSVPYQNIVMRRAASPEGLPAALPEGFSLRLYRAGDERHWARIETSAGEFPDEAHALAHYADNFLPLPEEIRRRALFVLAPDGLPVGTTTAWFADGGAARVGCLHWVAVHPAWQGKGLGRALVREALRLEGALEPARDVYLHTQTWSWRAVSLYESEGFRLCRTDSFTLTHPVTGERRTAQNDFAAALAVLRTRLPETLCDRLERTAV